MGWKASDAGNGTWFIADDGQGINPSVNFNGTITTNPQLTQNFGRILNEQFNDNEQVLFDKPQTYNGTFEYIGVSNISTHIGVSNISTQPQQNNWFIVRRAYMNNRCTQMLFQANMSWTNRDQGWPL